MEICSKCLELKDTILKDGRPTCLECAFPKQQEQEEYEVSKADLEAIRSEEQESSCESCSS